MTAQPGVILALHRNRDPGDFTVLRRVIGNEFPPLNVAKEMDEARKLRGFPTLDGPGEPTYLAVWFQPVNVPKV